MDPPLIPVLQYIFTHSRVPAHSLMTVTFMLLHFLITHRHIDTETAFKNLAIQYLGVFQQKINQIEPQSRELALLHSHFPSAGLYLRSYMTDPSA